MKETLLKLEAVAEMIFWIRGEKVILDRGLAKLYGVETRTLKQAVRRNRERFPEDFMFVLTREELADWRSQIVMSKEDEKGLRHQSRWPGKLNRLNRSMMSNSTLSSMRSGS